MEEINNLTWYRSTAGPGISSTIIGIAGNVLPLLNLVLASHGIQLMPDTINVLVSIGVFLFFSFKSVVGYVRAKKVLGAQIVDLRDQVAAMGGTPRV